MENEPKELTYLAGPYWDEDPVVREQRYDDHFEAACWLFKNGIWCFSPVAYSHPVNEAVDRMLGNEEWYEFDLRFVPICDSLTVLMQEGTDESKGVGLEVDAFQAAGKPTYMIFWVSGRWKRVPMQIHKV